MPRKGGSIEGIQCIRELGLDSMHCHISGIAYTEKGEKNHLLLRESDYDYIDLMAAFREFGLMGLVICESPKLEEDALLLQDTFRQ